MPSQHVEAFSTPGINPPPAFDRLRADLHAAAGPDRIAGARTRDSIEQLRTRAEFFRIRMSMFQGTGLGNWYAELDRRFSQFADELEADAKANGVLS